MDKTIDYYPYGWRMSGRVSIGGERYRFGYQGQFAEYDPETGYNHFEARLLDTRIGRWLTTDPAGQFFSPYVSMGNNPVNGVDPDGRLFGKLRAQFFTLFNGGSYDKLNGNWVARNNAGLVVKNFGGSWFKGTNEWKTSIEIGKLEYAGYDTYALMGPKSPGGFFETLNKIDNLGRRTWNDPNTGINYYLDDEGNIIGNVPIMGVAPFGGKLKSSLRAIKLFSKGKKLSDYIRTGKTVVPNQLVKGKGATGITKTWAIKGGGKNMRFHYHIHKYNWYKPWIWFKHTPIIKPPK